MENAMAQIGMVIPTLGTRPTWLRGTLDSIFGQIGVDIQVVIVTPRPDEVTKIAIGTPARVFASDTPGISAAVNEGWAELRDATYLAWLGDDDLLAPGSLQISQMALGRNDMASATYGNVRYIDAENETLFVTHPGRIARAYLPWGKDLVPQPGSLFRRTAIDAVGGLDTSLRYAMDFDIFLKLRTVGPLLYLPTEVAAFRLHPGSITGANRSSVEAEEVRARTHSARVNGLRRSLSPLQGVVDRALYKLSQRRGGVVPDLLGREYVLDVPGAADFDMRSS
ncbi:glycosyltransferase [Cryobacterium breve]|uniref:Glycosyltransferase n=1 Tax=Cryobacterium breve TaxID=1259258 RepID=A0ABY7NA71_9MICO|nr:glycosyltransferase [Cryobacterium breve]WBM79376.1 glycosyltransferase [Cryobacterium breve]